jgi:hypothetical protein
MSFCPWCGGSEDIFSPDAKSVRLILQSPSGAEKQPAGLGPGVFAGSARGFTLGLAFQLPLRSIGGTIIADSEELSPQEVEDARHD